MIFSTFSYLLGVLCGSVVNYATTPVQTNVETLREGIEILLKRIESKEAYKAVPSNEEERQKWYANLTHALKRVIQLGQETNEKPTLSKELLYLGMGGHACGSRWVKETTSMIKILEGDFSLEGKGLNEMVGNWLESYKEGILDELTMELTKDLNQMALEQEIMTINEEGKEVLFNYEGQQPHIFNLVAKVAMEELGLSFSKNLMINLNDPFMPVSEVSVEDVKEAILNRLHPAFITFFVRGKILDELKTNPNSEEPIRTAFEAYAKDFLSEEIKGIESTLDQKKQDFGVKQAEFLLKENTKLKSILDKSLSQEDKDYRRLFNEVRNLDDKERLAKIEEVSRNIEKYTRILSDKAGNQEELKELGTERAVNQMRLEISEVVEKYLTNEKIMTSKEVSKLVKDEKKFGGKPYHEISTDFSVGVKGLLGVLKQLGYLKDRGDEVGDLDEIDLGDDQSVYDDEASEIRDDGSVTYRDDVSEINDDQSVIDGDVAGISSRSSKAFQERNEVKKKEIKEQGKLKRGEAVKKASKSIPGAKEVVNKRRIPSQINETKREVMSEVKGRNEQAILKQKERIAGMKAKQAQVDNFARNRSGLKDKKSP